MPRWDDAAHKSAVSTSSPSKSGVVKDKKNTLPVASATSCRPDECHSRAEGEAVGAAHDVDGSRSTELHIRVNPASVCQTETSVSGFSLEVVHRVDSAATRQEAELELPCGPARSSNTQRPFKL